MDFLGLRNLTILHKAVQNVEKHRGIKLNVLKFPLDDPQTFALLQRGETKGIFQFEGGGIRDLLTKMKPDVFADIIATTANAASRDRIVSLLKRTCSTRTARQGLCQPGEPRR